MKFLIWLDKLSVQITTGQTCPVVANNHTIWIRHWNHFENNFLSQLLGFSALACNELDEPLHNKARTLAATTMYFLYLFGGTLSLLSLVPTTHS
jgi:hypothetical protein